MFCNIYLCFIKEILEIEILKPKSLFSLLGFGHWGRGADIISSTIGLIKV